MITARLPSALCDELEALPDGAAVDSLPSAPGATSLTIRRYRGWTDLSDWRRVGVEPDPRRPGSTFYVPVFCILSDPSSYQGGILETTTGLPGETGAITTWPRTRGTVFKFQTNAWHRFSEVTAGELVLLTGLRKASA